MSRMKIDEALSVLKGAGMKIISEKMTKKEMRRAAVDATFEKLGVSPAEYGEKAEAAMQKTAKRIEGVHSFRTFEGFADSPYAREGGTWYFYIGAGEGGRAKRGAVVCNGSVAMDNVAGAFEINASFFKAGVSVIRKFDPVTIEYTRDPEADIDEVVDVIRDIASQFEEEREDVVKADSARGKFSWADVRREIDNSTLWDIVESDRPDITGYLQFGSREIPFAMYRADGKLIRCKSGSAWLTNSFRFDKMEVFYGDESDREDVAAAKDYEELADALLRL